MEDVVSTLENNDETPFVLAFQESWIPQLMMALSLGGMINSEEPNFIDNMNAGTGSYSDIDEVFGIIDLIMDNGTEKPFETGGAAGSAAFANGEAAMWVQGPWMSGSILEVNPDMNIGLAPLPVTNNADTTMINLSTSTSLALSPTCEDKDVAIKLLNFILDADHSSDLFEELQFNPLATVHDYETMPWIDEAMSYVADGKAYLEEGLPNGVTDVTASMLQEYYSGTKTQQEVIEAIDQAWASAIAD
jgi:raffinose/stachyose/melibiose transport system substrate-binding protein